MTVLANTDNGHVSFKMESNFSLDKWEEYLSVGYMKEALKWTRGYFQKEIDKRFKLERGPVKPWRKLSPITKRYKKGTKKLQESGKLRKSIKVKTKGNDIVFESRCKYAYIHQNGFAYTTTPRQSYWMWQNLFGKKGHPFRPRNIVIPARPFFGFSKKNVKDVERKVYQFAKKSENANEL